MLPVQTYLELFDALRKRKRWSSSSVLRFAALSLASMENPNLDVLIEAGDAIKRKAGWWSSLNSPIRFVVAATILRHGLDPLAIYEEADRLSDRMKERGLRKAGTRGLIAALSLVLRNDGRQPHGDVLLRMRRILEQWKADHRWITDSSDYTMAAFHAASEEPLDGLTERIEAIYQELRASGYGRGNALQLASQILGIRDWPASGAAHRFAGLDQSFRDRGLKARRGLWDELAIISLFPGDTDPLADEILDLRAQLRAARPRPMAEIAFSLATGLAMQRALAEAAGAEGMHELFHLRTAQAILEAEQAVVVASTVAAASATASS